MKRSDHVFVVFLTAPAAIFILAFFAYPVILLIYNSFFNVSLLALKERTFVGLANYINTLTNQKTVNVFVQTLEYTTITLISEFVLGFLAALTFQSLGKKIRGFKDNFSVSAHDRSDRCRFAMEIYAA